MTPSAVAAFALVALLAVLVGFAVPTLVQIRRTARAVEEFVRSVTPRIENATSNLDSVLGRADRILRGMEDGTRGITGALGSVGAFLSNLRPPAVPGGGASSWLAALASLLSGFWQAWSVFTTPAPATAGGGAGGSGGEGPPGPGPSRTAAPAGGSGPAGEGRSRP